VVSSPLYVGSRDGLARVVRGKISHERVSEHLVRKPRAGHLVRPGAVALTFDDGPATGYTQTVLRLLHRAHVHATFCMIGSPAAVDDPAEVDGRPARLGPAGRARDPADDLRRAPPGRRDPHARRRRQPVADRGRAAGPAPPAAPARLPLRPAAGREAAASPPL